MRIHSSLEFIAVLCLAVVSVTGCGSDSKSPDPNGQQAAGTTAGGAPGVGGAGAGGSVGGAGSGGAGTTAPTSSGGSSAAGGAGGSAGASGSAGAAGAAGMMAVAGMNSAGTPAMPMAGSGEPAMPGYVRTSGSKLLDSQGREVRLTGVSWFGMETPNFAPFGLDQRSLGSFLDQIKSLGFNVIRLPYSNQLFDSGSRPNIGGNQNADLMNLSGLELMDKVVQGAGMRGLKIILDRHRPDANAQSELWYTGQYSEQRWIDDWKMLATRYKSNATVIAADLHNEPRGPATWGDGNMMTDWQKAAERAGNAIHEVNPNWLIIVEGIEKVGEDFYWWGGNLMAAGEHPVTLKVPNRVVYSTHDYPSSLYQQTWFMAADYPNNLAAVWTKYWGYLAEQNLAPVFVGEFGTKLQTESDKQWLKALAGYMGQRMSWSFWCWNPNSDDTGGILQNDWMSVNQDKMNEIKAVQAPLVQ